MRRGSLMRALTRGCYVSCGGEEWKERVQSREASTCRVRGLEWTTWHAGPLSCACYPVLGLLSPARCMQVFIPLLRSVRSVLLLLTASTNSLRVPGPCLDILECSTTTGLSANVRYARHPAAATWRNRVGARASWKK
jgi:hypothetical protein